MSSFRIIFAGMILLSCGGVSLAPAGAAQARGQAVEPRVEQLRAQGVVHYKERQYFQAIRAFEAALEMAGPARAGEFKELIARAHSSMGVELFNSGEIRQAEESFREALEQAEDPYAHFGMGFLHFVKLQDADALRHLNAAFRLEPTYAKTHKVLALLDYRQGRVADALRKMEKAVGLDPRDGEARALYDRWKAESSFTEEFREHRLGRFLVRSDPDLPMERVRVIAGRLRKLADSIARSFQLAEPPRTVVVLFSGKRFHKATGSYHWVGGVYDGQIKLPVESSGDVTAEERDTLDAALRHELTHVIVRSICPECPNWLNEGIAQHFERQGDLEDVRVQLRQSPAKRIRFRDVPARLWEVEDQDLARRTYLQGLDFVEFLIAQFHEFRLRLLLESIHQAGSTREAFRLTYGWTLEEAEDRWWKEVEKGIDPPRRPPQDSSGDSGRP